MLYSYPFVPHLLRLPPAPAQGVVSGIAVGGLVTSSLSFVSQLRAQGAAAAGGGDEPQTAADVAPAAFSYFSASAAVIGACIAGYWSIPWLPYGRYKLLLAGIIDDPKERKMLTVRGGAVCVWGGGGQRDVGRSGGEVRNVCRLNTG